MTLAEKILHLRTTQNLSQGDLAEQLEVSRQSVSKWETGQSVPDLDKIIKLADLFGVSIDELVREESQPQPEQPVSDPQVIYVEKRSGLTSAQITGVCLMVFGGIAALLGLLSDAIALVVGLALIVIALPLVLARKHPWLICGWVVAVLGYIIFTPWWTSTPRSLLAALRALVIVLLHPETRYRSTLIGVAISLFRSLLSLTLLILSVRAWRRRK